MIKVTETPGKTTLAKKNIKLEGIYVNSLKFVDETGDITQDVISEIPEGVEQISFRISVEIPEEPVE